MIWLLLIIILVIAFSIYFSYVREKRLHSLTKRIGLKVQHSIETLDECIENLDSRMTKYHSKLASTSRTEDVTVNEITQPVVHVGDVVIHADLIFPLYAQFFSTSDKDMVRIKSSSISLNIPELYLMSTKKVDSLVDEILSKPISTIKTLDLIDTWSAKVRTTTEELQIRHSNSQ